MKMLVLKRSEATLMEKSDYQLRPRGPGPPSLTSPGEDGQQMEDANANILQAISSLRADMHNIKADICQMIDT